MIVKNFITRWAARKALRWADGYIWTHEPNVFIGGREDPYLIRWYVIPRNRWFNIYLHEFRRSDDDRALHDHPWWSVSLSLNYAMEEYYRAWNGEDHWREIKPGSLVFRRARFAHRMVVCFPGALTIFITGPKIREWGFLCPQGWVPWKVFTETDEHGRMRGCGET